MRSCDEAALTLRPGRREDRSGIVLALDPMHSYNRSQWRVSTQVGPMQTGIPSVAYGARCVRRLAHTAFVGYTLRSRYLRLSRLKRLVLEWCF